MTTPDPAHNIDAFCAAREWAAEHVHPQPDDRMLKAYGRVLLDDAHHRLDDARQVVRRLVHMEREHLGTGRDGHLSERDLAPLLHALHIDPEETP